MYHIIMEWKELINLRESKNLSKKELAAALNVSREAVQKWESGLRKPPIEMAISIADFFNVSLDYLFDHKTTGVMISKEDAGKLIDLKTVIESIDKKTK